MVGCGAAGRPRSVASLDPFCIGRLHLGNLPLLIQGQIEASSSKLFDERK